MIKNCNNCYWKYYAHKWCIYQNEKPEANICAKHRFICEQCDSEEADYIYENKNMCSSCLLSEFEVEESTTTNYYLQGEYIGSDDDIDEVIFNLDDSIKELR